jgi:chemotaxis protein histidine kinase CheA
MPTYTLVNEEAETPARKRRTRAEILADNAALQELHDSPTIPLDEFVKLLRIWEKRYNSCTDAERILQRNCGLRFLARSMDYETGNHDEDDRFNPRPGSDADVDKLKIIRAIKMVKRSYGVSAHGIKWLEGELEKKFGLTVKQYNDTYTLTWDITVTAKELIDWGWDGEETAAKVGEAVRYNRGVNYNQANLKVVPDPTRAADAAAAEARKAAAKAAAAAEAAAAPATEAEALKADEDAKIAEDLIAAKAEVQEIVAETNRLRIPVTDTAALNRLREQLAGHQAATRTTAGGGVITSDHQPF